MICLLDQGQNDVLKGAAEGNVLVCGSDKDMFTFQRGNRGTDSIRTLRLNDDGIDLRGIFRRAGFNEAMNPGSDKLTRLRSFVELVVVGDNTQIRCCIGSN